MSASPNFNSKVSFFLNTGLKGFYVYQIYTRTEHDFELKTDLFMMFSLHCAHLAFILYFITEQRKVKAFTLQNNDIVYFLCRYVFVVPSLV